jgi:hypothetical protein
LRLGIWFLEFEIWNLRFGICVLEFEIWNLRFGICVLEFEIWNLRFGIWDLTEVEIYPICSKPFTFLITFRLNADHLFNIFAQSSF